jgi:ADP-ribose pyrophosphatase YjhB (NUDIX family)
MRKTAAAYHVVPSDLGFTETVNLSSSESQGDVGHRVGDLPLIRYAQRIVSSFLRDDLGLPLKHTFDLGEEQDDRLAQAQSDDIYIKNGTIGVSEAREMRFGLPEPAGQTVPRFVFTSRAGPIPLNSLYGVAGPIDPQTAAPAEGAELPHMAFEPPEGVLPNPPLVNEPLAEQEFGPSAIPPAPPPQPGAVAKEATAGITSETGITGYDLAGRDDDEDDEADEREQAAKAELASFRRYSRARIAKGQWRDFEFLALDAMLGHRLNQAGRFAVRKQAGEIAVAGLAVLAADTGRVLMLQRALCEGDPAGGTWEFPGGHLEQGEKPVAAAAREWCEETGCILPFDPDAMAAMAFGNGAGWTSGIYAGFVYPVPSEDCVAVRSGGQVTNPDDPDGDQVEAIAWWDPAQLPGNPALRPELLADLEAVMAALDCGQDTPAGGDEATCPCGTPVVYDEMNGWQHADGSVSHDDGESVSDKMAEVAKAADAGPKDWPGWEFDGPVAAHWAPQVTAAAAAALTEATLSRAAADYLAAHPDQQGDAPGKRDRNDDAHGWLSAWLAAAGITLPLAAIAAGIVTDGYLIGAVSAHAMATGQDVETGGWKPGDEQAAHARIEALDAGGPFGALFALAVAAAAEAIAAAVLASLARILAGADGTASATDLGAELAAAAAGPGIAERAVADQVTTVSAQAARDRYEALGVTEVMWVTDPGSKTGVCPLCAANEAASPQPLGEPWPSGECPVHPGCRCAECPVSFA